MCDTIGFINSKSSLFAKNSDRSPNEPQIIEFIPAETHSEKNLKTTYITIPQAEKTHALLLSRPTWIWGGEMGVNDCGVCIGNEAVWTKGKYESSGLTGMDLLRLALERSSSAEEARDVIIDLLKKYGQGGNCGYDHDFFYDNSFLILDRKNLFVLETCGKDWVWKKTEKASISNRLSIGCDGDAYSRGMSYNFAKSHSDMLYNFASGSSSRKQQTERCLKKDMNVKDMFDVLRKHNDGVGNPFSQGSVNSTCMHFGGVVGDHTTASMVVELTDDKTIVWTTGTSTPCASLFKPWVFGNKENVLMTENEKYWYSNEQFRRKLIGRKVPDDYYSDIANLENKWMSDIQNEDYEVLIKCFEDEKAFIEKWTEYPFENVPCKLGYINRWEKKNRVFEKEREIYS